MTKYLRVICAFLILTGCSNPKRFVPHQTPGSDSVILVFILNNPYYEVFIAEYRPAEKRVEPKRQIGAARTVDDAIKLIRSTFDTPTTIRTIWKVKPPFDLQADLDLPASVDGLEIQPIPDDIEVYNRFHLR